MTGPGDSERIANSSLCAELIGASVLLVCRRRDGRHVGGAAATAYMRKVFHRGKGVQGKVSSIIPIF